MSEYPRNIPSLLVPIGNNSCGVHSVMAAKAGTGARTSDIELARIIKRDNRRGQIYRKLKDLRDRYLFLRE